ncbi:hypothetical protein E2C01_094630 [Portunus trituberculatus]|uniref:Uncharacterized protein n=1 Tax=Portunus trituberculatus TaxID=210409 RepID=A0A5B7JWM1_PORTR|nr:hypothetical protein [Portunus trituberculatus]
MAGGTLAYLLSCRLRQPKCCLTSPRAVWAAEATLYTRSTAMSSLEEKNQDGPRHN